MLTLPSAAFITIRYSHWQGIVSAVTVVIAASDTFEEFVVDNSHKAIKWLFYSGLKGQQAFPLTSVKPNIVQDAILGGEGTPSPMLSIAASQPA
jgi:fatty acid synthase subunit alpha